MGEAAKLSVRHSLRDVLAYLPRKVPVEYGRNEIIYNALHPSTALVLVLKGRVKVTTKLEDRSEVVKGIYGPEEMFGESGLLGNHADSREWAGTLERSHLLSWTDTEVEDCIQRYPWLGIILIELAAARCVEFADRLESIATEKTPARVARALLRFASTAAQLQPDGAVRIPPLTHQVIAGYVGTSRWICWHIA